MLKIAAVDDELHVLERFERIALEVNEVVLCGLFETGEALINYMNEQPLDAVFLDIEMPNVNGLQLSQQILNINESTDIVFVTAFNQFAVEAFELQAIDYILKPMTEERFRKTINRILKIKKPVLSSNKPFIQCFGDFEVFINGNAVVWKNSKAKEVLAFLVHKKGIPVSWEKIADAVWPNYDYEKAQTNFHATTYLLRKKLAEIGLSHIIENGRGNYKIVIGNVDCDAFKLEEILNNKKVDKKDDLRILEQFVHRGYMEESGCLWAQPKAIELMESCKRLVAQFRNDAITAPHK